MKSDSKTAQLAAAHRAYHFEHHQPPVLEDCLAATLLQPPFKTVLANRVLRWLFWRPLFNKVQPISTFVVVRSRITEDFLEAAIRAGTRQYVILGAGLDSWALRNQTSDAITYELDHPDTQAAKQASIASADLVVPDNLNFVPIDFEADTISDVLANGSFDSASNTFVSWLGTICYLSDEAISQTFESLARVCAPGSQIVFDYFLPKSMMEPDDAEFFDMLNEGGTKRGEPMISFHSPEDIRQILESVGFSVVQDLDAAEITQRYLGNRADGLSVPGFVQVCCAEKSA